MLTGRVLVATSKRNLSTAAAPAARQVPILPNTTLQTFQQQAFTPALPALLPRQTFASLPAITKWFVDAPSTQPVPTKGLNHPYLARFGSAIVPLEISNEDRFARTPQALSFFLACVYASPSTSAFAPKPSRSFSTPPLNRAARKRSLPFTSSPQNNNAQTTNTFFSSAPALTAPTARIYLAQAPLADLPSALRSDVPIPNYVTEAGKGDVYDSALWLGEAPTYTPLHRDPNPNLFVQLAGRKTVRLMRPGAGEAVFAAVQEKIGGRGNSRVRGEEMMAGAEKVALEEEVWGEGKGGGCWEASLEAGDGLFIPKGWWHSVKGTGEGMTGSVNWWFR